MSAAHLFVFCHDSKQAVIFDNHIGILFWIASFFTSEKATKRLI